MMPNITYDFNNKIILVVEDNEYCFKFLSLVLKETEAYIIRAENGFDAIKILMGNSNIDLVLMDIRLPGIDGMEVINRIQKFYDVPIIIQTAYPISDEEISDKNIDFADIIIKPINRDNLLKKIASQFMLIAPYQMVNNPS